MRLWHQALLPYLDRQRLLSQHRECCALRGKGWGKKHATVDYVFKHDRLRLYAYHFLVMKEMQNRGYNVTADWFNPYYRGKELGYEDEPSQEEKSETNVEIELMFHDPIIYPEHDEAYLKECIALLKAKKAPIDFDKVEKELELK